jgi:hypothetical protein
VEKSKMATCCTLVVFLLLHVADQLSDGLTALLYFSQASYRYFEDT